MQQGVCFLAVVVLLYATDFCFIYFFMEFGGVCPIFFPFPSIVKTKVLNFILKVLC